MAKTEEFFSTFLPQKLENNPSLKDIGAVFQFEIAEAGTWSLDLSAGEVTEGAHDDPGCVITTDRASWEKILENPSSAIQMFMMGKLKASNIGLATKLQQILA
ncbi:MAG: putative sterol carrier protein [Myxococcota bacterium]|jgi:putative sterol carrier protein